MRSPLEDLKSYQAKRVRELLVFAARHCEFYRERLVAAGLKAEHDLTIDNLKFIPVLTKSDVRQHFDALLAAGEDRSSWLSNSSGGSTGQTIVLMQDGAYREENSATGLVSDRMQGYNFGNRVAMLWGGPGDTRAWRTVKARILSYLANRRLYDSFDMSIERMWAYHRDLQRFQPDNIIAYAGSAWLFARFLLQHGLKPNYPKISIITSAEMLTEEMRGDIEACFRVPVYNRYGSREAGCIASECLRRAGLHVHSDKYLEVLDIERDAPVLAGPGRIIVTLLSGRAMPLIRYDLGDVGVSTQESCTCGLNTPLLSKLLGRSSDFILAPSGRMIHGEYFTHVFYGRRCVKQFQFVQESPARFAVRIVLDGCPAPCPEEESIRHDIVAVLGPDADLRFEYPHHIPPLPSGKFRFTVSQVTVPVNALDKVA